MQVNVQNQIQMNLFAPFQLRIDNRQDKQNNVVHVQVTRQDTKTISQVKYRNYIRNKTIIMNK